MTTATVLVTGNTYPVKDQIKALGGRWDAAQKGWLLPADKADAARALVGGTAPKSPAPARRPGWHPCGYPGCNPGYCDECDGKGGGRRSYGEW
jgi:hypothetical protein